MTRVDRQKWNRRYGREVHGEPSQPSEWLLSTLVQAGYRTGEGKRALDVACGAGRNALYLAALGFSVDAVDISPIALARGVASCHDRELQINWLEADLDLPFVPPATYDLILVIHYLNLPLLRNLSTLLNPGGWLVCEEHLRTAAEVDGPRRAEYRVDPETLVAACGDLRIQAREERVIRGSDGRSIAVARVSAQRD